MATVEAEVRTVVTDAFKMDYCRFGQGEENLVIIPGLSVQSVMSQADAIAQAYEHLAEDYTVFLFDRRKDLPESYSIKEMARDTAEAVRSLGLGPVYLFGTSQGGMIAMEMAVEYPEMVRKLALGSTAARVTDERFGVIEEWIRLAEESDPEGLYLSFGEAVYPKDAFEASRDLLVEAAGTVTEEELAHFIILAKGTPGFDMLDDLEKISCPVLVIGDRDDRVLGGEASVEIADHLKDDADSGLYMYDGYGHAVYDLAPDYKERLLRFFKDGKTD